MSLSVNLITDRTEADVAAGNEKGIYTHNDLNRVGTAVNEIAALLNEKGYTNDAVGRTDRTYEYVPRASDMEAYLAQITKLKDAFFVLQSPLQLPENMSKINFSAANNIEKILSDIYELANSLDSYYPSLGDLTLGENEI